MDNPIERFKDALARAEKAGIELYNAMALATAGLDGEPSVRMMLLKSVDDSGFVFYTNTKSQKGLEISRNPHVALCFWWSPLEEQVRVEGRVERVTDEEADAYFVTRPRGSQIAAWASEQSESIASRDELVRAYENRAEEFGDREIPRPPHWSGYRLKPERIEFWYGKPDRLHERILFTRRESTWEITELQP